MSRPHQLAGDRFYLSVRTSMLSEFRNSTGLLRAFEVGGEYTSFGLLCAALERMPGVRFPDHQWPSWFSAPARFTYKNHDYQVHMPFSDFWVGPVAPDEAWPETEDLLAYVKRNLLGKQLHRIRARYVLA
jgi:hypothetical protein